MRLIAGLDTPDTGTIEFDSQKVSDLSPGKRKVGYVFQQYALWPHLSVRGNLLFGLSQQKLPRTEIDTRISRTLEMLGIGPLESRFPFQLSGGQQQRVALARALVLAPRVLLLDEPLSNLDTALKEDFLKYLHAAHRELKSTIIYVTHDRLEALQHADRLGVLGRGTLKQVASPRDVYARPENLEAARALGALNLIPARSAAHSSSRSVAVTQAGSVLLPRQFTSDADQDILLGVRPESLEFTSRDEEGLAATVQELRFRGAVTEVVLSVGSSTRWIMHCPSTEELPRIGTEVFLTASPENLLLFGSDGSHV